MDRTIPSKCVGRATHIMALVACWMFSSLASAETVTYYVVDHLGSPVAAMQSDGTLLWRESYDPYGNKRDNPSSADNDSGYTGHQFDAATDLTYMQARYYDPVVGRFMGVDPVHFHAPNPTSFNRFLYVNNNPYRYTDPTGREAQLLACYGGPVPCAIVIGGTVIGAIYFSTPAGQETAEQIKGILSEGSENGEGGSGEATGEDATGLVTGDSEPRKETSRSGTTTQHFPPVSGEKADEIMGEVKGLSGVEVEETSNERGSVTVVTTPDGTRVIDRVGAGNVRSIETQSPDGKNKTKTRIE